MGWKNPWQKVFSNQDNPQDSAQVAAGKRLQFLQVSARILLHPSSADMAGTPVRPQFVFIPATPHCRDHLPPKWNGNVQMVKFLFLETMTSFIVLGNWLGQNFAPAYSGLVCDSFGTLWRSVKKMRKLHDHAIVADGYQLTRYRQMKLLLQPPLWEKRLFQMRSNKRKICARPGSRILLFSRGHVHRPEIQPQTPAFSTHKTPTFWPFFTAKCILWKQFWGQAGVTPMTPPASVTVHWSVMDSCAADTAAPDSGDTGSYQPSRLNCRRIDLCHLVSIFFTVCVALMGETCTDRFPSFCVNLRLEMVTECFRSIRENWGPYWFQRLQYQAECSAECFVVLVITLFHDPCYEHVSTKKTTGIFRIIFHPRNKHGVVTKQTIFKN